MPVPRSGTVLASSTPVDPSADPPGRDESERERRARLLRRVEGASRSPLQPGQLPRALRAISIALALLGLAAWWFVMQEQKRQPEDEPVPVSRSSGPGTTQSPVGDAAKPRAEAGAIAGAAKADGTTPAAGAAPSPGVGSFDRDRGRPLDRDRPNGR